MNRALSFVLIVLVVASAALNVLLFRRQKEIEQRLDGLEKKPAPAATARTAGSDPDIRTVTDPTDLGERFSNTETQSGPRRIERKDESATEASTASLPADLRAAIAKEVEAQIKKRPQTPFFDMPEPIKVMEAELGLSPSQLVRIKELLKKRQEEQLEVHDQGLKMRETMDKIMEIDNRYEELIKRELDVEQQKKYDELKKSGKLMTGAIIKFGAKKEDE